MNRLRRGKSCKCRPSRNARVPQESSASRDQESVNRFSSTSKARAKTEAERDQGSTAEYPLVRMLLFYFAWPAQSALEVMAHARDTYRCARHPLAAGDGQFVHLGRIHSHPARGGDRRSVAQSYPGAARSVTGHTRCTT